MESCAMDACREFQEEVGISLLPSQLKLNCIKVGGHFDDIGIIYDCELRMTEVEIRRAFELHVARENEKSGVPEFVELLFVDDGFFCTELEYEWVDYLPAVTHHLTKLNSTGAVK